VADVDDLNGWIKTQRQQAQALAKISPLPEIPERKIETKKAEVDIFDLKRAQLADKTAGAIVDEKILKMYPLAGVPIEQLSYTGFFMQGNKRVALISTGKKIVRGHVGDKIGDRLGQITEIGESKVQFVEQIENQVGKLTNRVGTLELISGETNGG
jgi:Tfp pilus assembly protein PilP